MSFYIGFGILFCKTIICDDNGYNIELNQKRNEVFMLENEMEHKRVMEQIAQKHTIRQINELRDEIRQINMKINSWW